MASFFTTHYWLHAHAFKDDDENLVPDEEYLSSEATSVPQSDLDQSEGELFAADGEEDEDGECTSIMIHFFL